MLKESDRKWDSAFYWPLPPAIAGLFHSSVSILKGPDVGLLQFGHLSFFPFVFSSAARGSGSARRVCREFALVWSKFLVFLPSHPVDETVEPFHDKNLANKQPLI